MTIDPAKAVGYVYTDNAGLSQATNTIAHVSQTFSRLQMGWSLILGTSAEFWTKWRYSATP